MIRPIAEAAIAVLLVGCLVVAVVVARGQEPTGAPCEGPYTGRALTPEDLATVLHSHAAWLAAGGLPDDPRRANLCQAILQGAQLQKATLRAADLQLAFLSQAHLQGADLGGARLQMANLARAHLQEADLGGAHLQKANLEKANLEKANLQNANLINAKLQGALLPEAALHGAHLQGASLFKARLRGAVLFEADLRGANLFQADLRGVRLTGTDLQGADLGGAQRANAVYEPKPDTLPVLWVFARADARLEELVFRNSPAGLLALREAFKRAGMRAQERQITYAIERTKRRQAWDPSWDLPGQPDARPWLARLAGKGESLFSYALFELPSGYGMAPGRALWGLLGCIPLFALPYGIAVHTANRRSGIWMIVPADRLARGRRHEKIVLVRPHAANTWRERRANASRLIRTSLYFSLLPAFHLGWREFNVGSWIARLQPREYTLRATGWVRTVSGIQSLLSVYLLALWVLSYFGRPFE